MVSRILELSCWKPPTVRLSVFSYFCPPPDFPTKMKLVGRGRRPRQSVVIGLAVSAGCLCPCERIRFAGTIDDLQGILPLCSHSIVGLVESEKCHSYLNCGISKLPNEVTPCSDFRPSRFGNVLVIFSSGQPANSITQGLH